MGRRHSAEQWARWIREQPRSGLTIVAYCESRGVSPKSFYRWRARLAEERVDEEAPDPGTFVPVTVIGAREFEVDLPCGATLRVPAEESLLRIVLGLMRECTARTPGEPS